MPTQSSKAAYVRHLLGTVEFSLCYTSVTILSMKPCDLCILLFWPTANLQNPLVNVSIQGLKFCRYDALMTYADDVILVLRKQILKAIMFAFHLINWHSPWKFTGFLPSQTALCRRPFRWRIAWTKRVGLLEEKNVFVIKSGGFGRDMLSRYTG